MPEQPAKIIQRPAVAVQQVRGPVATAGLGTTASTELSPVPAAVLSVVEAVTPVAEVMIPVAGTVPVRQWKFIKQWGVSDTLNFADGTSFQFRWIRRTDGGGYAVGSYVVTSDEKLAANLREAAKNHSATGILEV